jgi:hypothetical protein
MLGCAINGQKRMFDLLSHLLGNVKPMFGQPSFVLINIRALYGSSERRAEICRIPRTAVLR